MENFDSESGSRNYDSEQNMKILGQRLLEEPVFNEKNKLNGDLKR